MTVGRREMVECDCGQHELHHESCVTVYLFVFQSFYIVYSCFGSTRINFSKMVFVS